jgi:hypothetical protein
MVLIASAATMEAGLDVGAAVEGILTALAAPSALRKVEEGHSRWWREFRGRTFVRIKSPDGLGGEFKHAVHLRRIRRESVFARVFSLRVVTREKALWKRDDVQLRVHGLSEALFDRREVGLEIALLTNALVVTDSYEMQLGIHRFRFFRCACRERRGQQANGN